MPRPNNSEAIQKPNNWPRLAGAAIAARNRLRLLAVELSAALESGSISQALVIKARDISAHHAEELKSALKHPSTEARRKFDQNLPAWSEMSGPAERSNRRPK